jgi:PAS domain S-box-containing protein
MRESILEKKAQDFNELKKAWAHVENILQTIVDPIIFVNFDGSIESVNQATLALLGWELNELLGKSLTMVLGEEKEFFCSKGFQKLISENGLANLEIDFRTETGELIPMLVSGSTMRDERHRLLGFVLVAKDFRDRKRLDQLKDEFVSTVSHELRTPIAIMKGAVENLRDGIIDRISEEEHVHVVEIIYQNTKRLEKLIGNLLDLSRLEAAVRINNKRVAIGSIIRELTESMQKLAEDRGIEVICEIDPSCPHIRGDSSMIEEVLMNLINNAIRFAQKIVIVAAQEVLNTETTREAKRFVKIIVADDGPGISTCDQPRLFHKFEQIDRPEGGAGYKGTGLGLAICKTVVEKHHGKIWVESKPGKGSKFIFVLPVWEKEHSEHSSPNPPTQSPVKPDKTPI